MRDRPVVVASAHGGYVSSPPMQPDFLTPYLQAIFETIGIHSLEFVRPEGMARGPEAVARARWRERLDRAAAPRATGHR